MNAGKYDAKYEESYAEVYEALHRLSAKLQELLPDPSIGPEERIERLARVVPTSVVESARHLTARVKLRAIRARLAALVPDPGLTDDGRIDWLVARVHELVPGEAERLVQKLEKLGDGRWTDTGHMGIDEALADRLSRVVYDRPGIPLNQVIEWVAEVLDENPKLRDSLHEVDGRMRGPAR